MAGEIAAGDGAGWHVALESLGTVLDGRDVDRPALFDRADEMARTYACAFGPA